MSGVPAFTPPAYLRWAHLQTLLPKLTGRNVEIDFSTERFELPDGDFLDLDHVEPASGVDDPPLVVVLHGLQGSRESQYARGMLKALSERGWRGVLMHFRGCGGEPNRRARSYHAGETGDLETVLDALHVRFSPPFVATIGYSLGGNVLLRYLASKGLRARTDAAAAISVPYRLADCARRLEDGFSRLYAAYLLRAMRAALAAKFRGRDALAAPEALDFDRAMASKTMFEFDDRATAPVHGFPGAETYYARCSSRPVLYAVRTPTLLVHSRDDPFMYPDVVPEQSELSASTTLALSDHGGHVGFRDAKGWWLERAVPDWLDARRRAGQARMPTL